MLFAKILLGLLGALVMTALLTIINRLFFKEFARLNKSKFFLLNCSLALAYTIGYWILIFIIEGEGSGTGIDQGLSGFVDTVPLFIIFLVVFSVTTVLPLSVLANAIAYSRLTKKDTHA